MSPIIEPTPAPAASEPDPFAEIDEQAERRRRQLEYRPER
jgi:hypothetical protein